MAVNKRNLLTKACVLLFIPLFIQATSLPVSSYCQAQTSKADTGHYRSRVTPNDSQSEMIIDQANEVLFQQYSYNIDLLKPIGQEFTPTLHALDAIELFIDDANCSATGSMGGSLKVVIHEGTIDGPIIGTSKVATFPSCFYNVLRFEFPSFIPLTPGKKYVMEPVYVSGNTSTVYVDKGPTPLYQPGSLVFQGALEAGMDMWFREGLATFIARKEEQAKKGGWRKLVRADGTPFKSEQDCLLYIKKSR